MDGRTLVTAGLGIWINAIMVGIVAPLECAIGAVDGIKEIVERRSCPAMIVRYLK